MFQAILRILVGTLLILGFGLFWFGRQKLRTNHKSSQNSSQVNKVTKDRSPTAQSVRRTKGTFVLPLKSFDDKAISGLRLNEYYAVTQRLMDFENSRYLLEAASRSPFKPKTTPHCFWFEGTLKKQDSMFLEFDSVTKVAKSNLVLFALRNGFQVQYQIEQYQEMIAKFNQKTDAIEPCESLVIDSGPSMQNMEKIRWTMDKKTTVSFKKASLLRFDHECNSIFLRRDVVHKKWILLPRQEGFCNLVVVSEPGGLPKFLEVRVVFKNTVLSTGIDEVLVYSRKKQMKKKQRVAKQPDPLFFSGWAN